MENDPFSAISSTGDLIDSKLEERKLCRPKQLCPCCGHKLEGMPDWADLPAGVKFDPTDQELIEHLEAKGEREAMKSHPLIDEFITTIEGDDGICYTHPDKLPGVTRDGLSRHFFHKPRRAYATGTRKRRKIQTDSDLRCGETRWHKTGKTRPVTVNGKQKGCKKILVLYTNFGKNRKPEKTNWVMHQYHLGNREEEREGELVVSKIFYQTQPRQSSWSERSTASTMAAMEEFSEPSGSRWASAAMSSYSGMDIEQSNADRSSLAPFRKAFNEVGTMTETSTARGVGLISAVMCQGHEQTAAQPLCHMHAEQPSGGITQYHRHPHHQMAMAAFAESTPSHPISDIISPLLLHHASIDVLDEGSYRPSRTMFNQNFQQQQQQPEEQHHKAGGTSATGLEEIIIGCTSSSTDLKEVSTDDDTLTLKSLRT
ncbi:hypothetical protein Nepgr_025619 [Nepenthes gracilis]|uniref:NAC domain-containing protein n=1 Tax=Nepenthes gracilis TaxID=150966 RepID=A0AAD3Y1P3_NEPGR|nr:hypothetical protein Nepgr_025619 [Nepenthes gracilis]